jgi:hypothetical protein
MGILSGLLGHASEVDVERLESEFATMLVGGEVIQHAYKLVRDLIVFSNKRLVLVDKQGLTGKKREYVSIPYSSIVRFSKETAGRFDMDAEIKLWIRGESAPMHFEFRKDRNVDDVYRLLSSYILS